MSTPVLDAITGDMSGDRQEHAPSASKIVFVAHWYL
jgi:hypothetical protein